MAESTVDVGSADDGVDVAEPMTVEQIDACIDVIRAELSDERAADGRAELLADLGEMLWNRYVVLSEEGQGPVELALTAAIDALEAARRQPAIDAERRLEIGWWIAYAWIDHFGLSEDVADLDRVVAALEELLDGPAGAAAAEANARGMLGQAYLVLSAQRGPLYRDRAITELNAALRLMRDDPGEPEPRWWWTAIEAYGSALAQRWHGELNAVDLDEAIVHLDGLACHNRRAGVSTDPGLLSELGRLLHDRAALRLAGSTEGDQLVGIADLDAAVAWTHEAADQVSADDPDHVAILFAAALAGWEHYQQSGDVTELSHVDELYTRAISAEARTGDGRAMLERLRELVRDELFTIEPSLVDPASPFLDPGDGPPRPGGLLRIRARYIDEAVRRYEATPVGDPTRARLAAMIAGAEYVAYQREGRELDWRRTLTLLEEARSGVPHGADALLGPLAAVHIAAAREGQVGHAELAMDLLNRALALAEPGSPYALELEILWAHARAIRDIFSSH
jgi:hypothetical protein